MIFWRWFWTTFLLVILGVWLNQPSYGQTQTTPELLTSSGWTGQSVTSNSNQTWDQLYGCCSGGPGALLLTNPNYGTGQIHFSWGQSTVAQTIAINQALSGTGIQVTGYNWAWTINNGGVGSLTAAVITRDNQDTVVHSFSQNYDGQVLQDVRFSGTQTYPNPYSLSNLGTMTMQFTGSDGLFWAGYYGPTVKNPSLTLNYTVDICATNPLSSPNCPGYFQAQCTVSPLYNPSCPGYQAAYFTQQCSINILYSPDCPGYSQAYFDYQCQQDGTYSTSCPNYAEAYAKKKILEQTSNEIAAITSSITASTTNNTTSSTSPTSVTSTTSVINPPTTTVTATVEATNNADVSSKTSTTVESKTAKKIDSEIKSSSVDSTTNSSVRGRVQARAKELTRAATTAVTLEEQISTQGLVLGLIGFVPEFDSYLRLRLADINGLRMQRQYNQPTVDNRSALRQLSSSNEGRHKQMVDQQWEVK